MRRLLVAVFVAFVATPVLADSSTAPPDRAAAPTAMFIDRSEIRLAQSGCAGQCSSSRGYCVSTCRDSFCRAVCNDRYQSCLSSCRR
jgi:hypothetical protein